MGRIIGFRVDANEHIASGHLMRCIAIAKACIKEGNKCIFFLAEEKMTERLKENQIPYYILNSKWNDMETEYKDLLNRLNRIEGQVRGIKKMVEEDAYCTDILTQVMAATAALNSFNRVLLKNHLERCVIQDIKEDKEGAVEELVALLQKMMK